MTDEIRREVLDAADYKEVVNAAATLGLEPTDHDFLGDWRSDDGHPVFPEGVDLESVGRKYFHVQADGRIIPMEPIDGPCGRGRVMVTLKG